MNEREIFAVVLLKLVRDKCKNGKSSVLRTSLQVTVPVSERHFARRGLAALVDHGALGMRGESLSLTAVGHAFLTQHASDHSFTQAVDVAQNTSLLRLRSAIRQDNRLSPTSVEAATALAERLQEHSLRLPATRSAVWPWIVAAAAIALIVYFLATSLPLKSDGGNPGLPAASES